MRTPKTKIPASSAKTASPFFANDKGKGFFSSGALQRGRNRATTDAGFFPKSPTVQTKLTVGEPGDVYEREADQVADRVVQRMSEPGQEMVQRCAACEQKEKIQKMSDSGSSFAAPPGIESGLNAAKGSGSPMSGNTRREMEDSFGVDFGHVRIHQDSSAIQMSKDLNAQAFTHGSDIYFNSSKYDDGSKSGKHLLAHELTHVVQQGSAGSGNGVRRQPGPGNVIQRQPGPGNPGLAGEPVDLGYVQDFNAADWLAKANIPAGTIPPGVMESEDFKVALLGALNPLSGSVLLPLNSVPPGLENIPDNHMMEVKGEDAMSIYLNTQDEQVDTSAGYPGGVGSGVKAGLGQLSKTLTVTGFNQAGPNAIGLVAFPMSNAVRGPLQWDWNWKSPLLPDSKIVLGHTALYARIDGKIVVMKSYATSSLTEAAMNFRGVAKGTKGVPASILDHMSGKDPGGNMWDVDQAKSIEYPVSREIVDDFIKDLPDPGPVEGGQYTAKPDISNRCNGENCVMWATEYVEKKLGVPIGKGGIPQVNAGGTADSALQGEVMKLVSQENPDPITLPDGTEIKPVTGKLPTSLRVLKWGGRIFTVIDVGRGIWRIWNAEGLERIKVIGEEAGRFGGGYVGGEAGAGACVVLGLATEGVGLVACGIGGAIAGSFVGEWLGEHIFGIPEGIAESLSAIPWLLNQGADAIHAMGNMVQGTFQFILDQNVQVYEELNYQNWDMRFLPDNMKNDINGLGQMMWRLLNDQKDLPPDADQQTKFFSILQKSALKMVDLGIPAAMLSKIQQEMIAADPTATTDYSMDVLMQMSSLDFVRKLKEWRLAYKQDPVFLANADTFHNNMSPERYKEGLDIHYRNTIESRAKLNVNNWTALDLAEILFSNYEKWQAKQPEGSLSDDELEKGYDNYRTVADTTESQIMTLGNMVWGQLGSLNYDDFASLVNSPLSEYHPDANGLLTLSNGLYTILKALGENTGMDRFQLMEVTPEYISSRTPVDLVDTLVQYDMLHFRKSPKEIADLALIWMNVGFEPW